MAWLQSRTAAEVFEGVFRVWLLDYLTETVASLSNGILLGIAVVIATVSTSDADYGLQ